MSGQILGNCAFCGLQLSYVQPGNPPGDAQTDLAGFYDPRHRPWRDFELTDSTGTTECFGAGAQREAGVAVGQTAHHALPGRPIG